MADKNDGRIRAWDNTAKEWKLVDRGISLPLSPVQRRLLPAHRGRRRADRRRRRQGPGRRLAARAEGQVDRGLRVRPARSPWPGSTGTCTYTGISGGNEVHRPQRLHRQKPDDGAVVISTTGTTVNGADQMIDGSHLTLTVADATNFPSAGAFTGKGLNGTCSYTSKTGTTQFNGITGCTGTPDDGDDADVRQGAGHLQVGRHRLDPPDRLDHATAPTCRDRRPHTDGTLFRLAEHEIIAEAGAGAGKTDVGIAGAVAINIVLNDHTEAVVQAGAHVTASSANVTIKAQSNELDLAKADSEAEDAKSVGVGAAVALNILTSTLDARRGRGRRDAHRRRQRRRRGAGAPPDRDRGRLGRKRRRHDRRPRRGAPARHRRGHDGPARDERRLG